MRRFTVLFSAFAVLAVAASAAAQAPPSSRVEDEAAIRAAIQSYVIAYNAGDAEGVAKHWGESAEWLSPDGKRARGRKAIAAEMTELFKTSPGLQIEVGNPTIRFVSADVAMEEGSVQVQRSGEPVSESSYIALHVKRDGHWLLDSVRETEIPDLVPPHDKLSGLAWMVGDWVDQSEESTVETKVTWTKNKQFLTYNFHVSLPGMDELEGTQIIAWDASAGAIRSWVFDSDGTLGEGTWSHDGKHWIVKSSQVLPDGRRAASTNIYTIQDDDRYTWKSIGRSIDGQFLPNIDEVSVVRKSAITKVEQTKEPSGKAKETTKKDAK